MFIQSVLCYSVMMQHAMHSTFWEAPMQLYDICTVMHWAEESVEMLFSCRGQTGQTKTTMKCEPWHKSAGSDYNGRTLSHKQSNFMLSDSEIRMLAVQASMYMCEHSATDNVTPTSASCIED